MRSSGPVRATRRYAYLSYLCLLLLGACTVGGRHTSDAQMEKNFFAHQAEFEALLAQIEADDKLDMISIDSVSYGSRMIGPGDPVGRDRLDPLHEHWARYEVPLRRLGIAQIGKGEGSVEFRVDRGSIMNGDSYKGYEYGSPPGVAQFRTRLDGYRMSESDKDRFGNYCVHKRLTGKWYLYLFVAR